MNLVTLMGRLTAAPELKTTSSGINYCRFTLAVDRRFQKQGQDKQTDFISCVAWRQTAEFICRYFVKGQLLVYQAVSKQALIPIIQAINDIQQTLL